MSDTRGANISRMVLKQAGRAKEKVRHPHIWQTWGTCMYGSQAYGTPATGFYRGMSYVSV
jgi:hypothetical protein